MPPHDDASSDADAPPWVGYWRVRRYDGAAPSVPTYYAASQDSWDVVKVDGTQRHLARHPILEIRDGAGPACTLLLKDEGARDDEAETWRVETDGDRVRVVATTGPHEGAVGRAERIQTDPREGAAPS